MSGTDDDVEMAFEGTEAAMAATDSSITAPSDTEKYLGKKF